MATTIACPHCNPPLNGQRDARPNTTCRRAVVVRPRAAGRRRDRVARPGVSRRQDLARSLSDWTHGGGEGELERTLE